MTVTRTDSVRVQHGHAYGLAKHGEALHSKTTSTEVTAAGNTCSSASTVSNSSHLPSSNKTTSKTSSGGLHGTTANGNASGTKGATQGNSQEGGVLGATASAGSSGPEGGVLGAIESASGGVLPFTGFPLWLAVIAALVLIVLGLVLRRHARATT